MNKQQDLSKAEEMVKDALARIEAMKHQINKLEQDVALHRVLEAQFCQNLNTLKQDGIIPLASEYKKTKTNLGLVRTRIHSLEIELSNNGVFLERAEQYLLECKSNYDILLGKSEAQVIKGNFGDRQE